MDRINNSEWVKKPKWPDIEKIEDIPNLNGILYVLITIATILYIRG